MYGYIHVAHTCANTSVYIVMYVWCKLDEPYPFCSAEPITFWEVIGDVEWNWSCLCIIMLFPVAVRRNSALVLHYMYFCNDFLQTVWLSGLQEV